MKRLFLSLALAACSPVSGSDAGVSVDGDRGDAAQAAGSTWERVGCEISTVRPPRFGEVAFCPADHDYIGARESRAVDAGIGDAGELCRDAGPGDSGPECGPWTLAEIVRARCATWLVCPQYVDDECYHCLDWSESPGLPIPVSP